MKKIAILVLFILLGNLQPANAVDVLPEPFFKYLNWNRNTFNEENASDREFIVQAVIESTENSNSKKRVDFLLQLDGKKKFIVEVKHPQYNLKEEIRTILFEQAGAISLCIDELKLKIETTLSPREFFARLPHDFPHWFIDGTFETGAYKNFKED